MGFILLGIDPDKNHFNAGEYLGCCIFLPLVLGEIICYLCSTLQRGRSCITNWKSSHKGLVTEKWNLLEKNAVIAHNKIAAFVVCCKQLTINIDLNPRSFKIDWRNAMASSQSSWNVMICQWTWLKLYWLHCSASCSWSPTSDHDMLALFDWLQGFNPNFF